jgi:uncharacterized protein YehS (DUF1456 family)
LSGYLKTDIVYFTTVHRRSEADPRLRNNNILNKLRIALELKADDIHAVSKPDDVDISKAELLDKISGPVILMNHRPFG